MVYSWKTIFRRIAVLLLMLGCVLVIIDRANKSITEYNQNELQNNIQAVIEQNAETLTMLLDKHKTLIEATATRIARFADDPAALHDYINRQSAIQSNYKFTRIGFIYPDGQAFASDGYSGNLGFREYFQRSMRGEIAITQRLHSALDPKHAPINVISAPVRNSNKEIVGVVFESIPTSVFTNSLNKGVFAEFGSSALINNNGEIIAANDNSAFLDKYSDLLVFATLDPTQTHYNAWEERLKNRTNTTTMFFNRDGGQYLHFAPMYIDGVKTPLHITVLLSQDTVNAQTSHFKEENYRILGMLILVAALGLCYYFVDIQRQEAKRRRDLEKIAYTSRLTKGANWPLVKKVFQQTAASGYLVYMDLRDFEVIRSSVGTEKSNAILKDIWSNCQEEFSAQDFGGHIEADYFAIFFSTDNLPLVVARLSSLNNRLQALSNNLDIPLLKAFFGLVYCQSTDDIELALSKANLAKQSIMTNVDALYAVYDSTATEDYLYNSQLEKNFSSYLQNKNFEVWYQPKFNCFTHTIIGAEALIRLRDEQGNLVPPAKFIPLFERDGLIHRLDEYVFQTVSAMQKQRQDNQQKLVPVSINLSRVSLYTPYLVENYVRIARKIGTNTAYLPLEITESAAVGIKDIDKLLQNFCKHGFQLHMDDFGTGYSSLSALNELPFSDVKIDKSLIDHIGQKRGEIMLKHTCALIKELGKHITAEGVETQAQLDFLKSLQVYSIQGYFFSKPIPYAEFSQMLEKY